MKSINQNINETDINQIKTKQTIKIDQILKFFLLIVFVVFSLILVYLLYLKTSFKFEQIKAFYVLYYKELILANLITFIAFILKAYRWKLVVDNLINKKIDFLRFMYLSALGSLINSVGLSIFISDGIKSGILSFGDLKSESNINKIKGIVSSYGDRILGMIAANILFIILIFLNYTFNYSSFFLVYHKFYKNLILIFVVIVIVSIFLIFLAIKYLNTKIVFFSVLISFISHLLDTFSMYLVFSIVLKQVVSFYIWVLAYLLGSVFSVFSVFAGLGARTIGLSYIINDLKNSFYIDVFYYLFQIFNSLMALVIFFLTWFINSFLKKRI